MTGNLLTFGYLIIVNRLKISLLLNPHKLMATFNLLLDTRVVKKNNQYNLSIRGNIGSKQLYVHISKMTKEQYYQIFIKKSMDKQSIDFRKKCSDLVTKSEKIFNEMYPFDPKRFRQLVLGKDETAPENSLLLYNLFKRFTDSQTNLKQRTIDHFNYSRSVFHKYKSDLNVLDLDSKFISQFVKYRLDSGVSLSAVNSSLRDLRRVINYFSNEECIIPKTYKYPFGKGGFSIQNFFPRKLVMSNEEIKSVIELDDFDSLEQEYARDIWVMLYRCNGINFVDLFRMRWDNIKGDYLIFFRKKTETTRKNNVKEIVVPITADLKKLIRKIGVRNSPYILGKLADGYSESSFENKNHKWKKILNRELAVITEKLNLSVPLRLKNARDSYASTLRRAKVSKDDIGDMLGHSNSIVTEHYLASIDMEATFDINKHLL